MQSKPVALVLGVGPNIGDAVVKRFARNGYLVAGVSRSAPEQPSLSGGILSIRADFTQHKCMGDLFDTVKGFFHASPTVVVYNSAHQSFAPDDNNMFSIDTEELDRGLSVMVKTPWAAAEAAVKAWSAEAESGRQRTFIYTGNGMPRWVLPMVDLATIGAGKSAAAYWVQVADMQFKDRGWRFFYADERTPEGRGTATGRGAESHAEFYLTLAEGNKDIPSWATFVQGKYKSF